MNGTTRVRRSRHLVSYWTDEGIVITNYATASSVVADAFVSHVLNLCGDWTHIRQLRASFKGVSPRSVSTLVQSMVNAHLLVREDHPLDDRERALDTWSDWNPAAGFFHFSTKDLPTPVNRESAEEDLRQEAQARGVPAPIKSYRRSAQTALPPPKTDGEFVRVLRERRTWRSFAPSSLSLADVSTLLQLTWGVQRTAQSSMGKVHLKTSPSSGARQPLEAYMLAVAVQGLPAGLYHYRADQHALEVIRKGATGKTIARYIPGQWWYDTGRGALRDDGRVRPNAVALPIPARLSVGSPGSGPPLPDLLPGGDVARASAVLYWAVCGFLCGTPTEDRWRH